MLGFSGLRLSGCGFFELTGLRGSGALGLRIVGGCKV